MKKKTFLYRAYLIFDLVVFPACFLLSVLQFDSAFYNYLMITATLYLCINSIAGIALCKKRICAEEKTGFSQNWLLGIYLANTIGVFSLFMPICQFADCLERNMFYDAFLFLMIIIAILIILIGQTKWQRTLVYNASTPKFFKISISIANPLRALFLMLMLFAMTVPVI